MSDEDLAPAAALLRELRLEDAPAWWLALADRRRGDPEDWAWVWAAEVIATFHPGHLLPFLTALRPIGVSRKQRALDTVGERLAVGLVEQPTLAACRAAIAEADEAPRRRSIFCTAPMTAGIDATLVAVVRDALGSTCTAEVERTDEVFPGDVNQPAVESHEVSVRGTRGATTLTVTAREGVSDLWVDVEAAAGERDRILATLWRAFARPGRDPEEEWQW